MFGNLIRECGVLDSLSETAQKVLANLITIFLGITIAFRMSADKFLDTSTLLIMGLGLIAFIVDTAGGVLFAKLFNVIPKLFGKDPINPMIGAAGISAFPTSGRTVHKMALEEDNHNFLLMHSIGVNYRDRSSRSSRDRSFSDSSFKAHFELKSKLLCTFGGKK